MRITILLVFCSGWLTSDAFAERLSQGEAKSLVDQATVVRQAYESYDVETIIRTAHPALIKLAGGKSQAEAMFRATKEQNLARGVRTLESKLIEPGEIYTSGDEIVCFIPRTSIIAVAGKKFISVGFVIAARKANGKEWSFLDGAGLREHPEMLRVFFPGLPENVQLPESTIKAANEANQPAQPTATAVTPPAGQESRRP